MSKTVDERVVSMQFDNSKFEKNVNKSMGTIEKLKNSLNFSKSSKSLEDLNKAAGNVNFAPMGNALDEIKVKFSAMEAAGFAVMERLVNKAIDAGERMVKALSIDNISSGWNKYTEKTQNVQTLINSTGLSINEINGYLEQLMWYSDETSYGFTDMTAALAQMTSSGGDIKDLVPMIMGIANATAFAGKGAAEFSRVIYNLNQAYSMDKLQTMDWRSIENAGAASKQLKQMILDAAEAEGRITKSMNKMENWSELLSNQAGYFNKKVLERAFKNFSTFTVEVQKAVDSGAYDTAAEAIDALSGKFDELSESAFRSAQESKSFKDAMDATADAVSSGWAITFEKIFGNYEESKKIWTGLTDWLWEVFAKGADARNAYVEDTFTKSKSIVLFRSQLENAGISLEEFEETWSNTLKQTNVDVDELIDKYGNLWEAMRSGAITTESAKNALSSLTSSILKKIEGANSGIDKEIVDKSKEEYEHIVRQIVRGNYGRQQERYNKLESEGWDSKFVQDLVNKVYDRNGKNWHNMSLEAEWLTGKVNELSEAQLKNAGYTETQIEALMRLNEEAKKSGLTLEELIESAGYEKTGRELMTEGFSNLGEAILRIKESISSAKKEIFGGSGVGLWEILYKFNQITEKLLNTVTKLTGITRKLNEETGEEEDEFVQVSDKAGRLTRIFQGLFAAVDIVGRVFSAVARVVKGVVLGVFEAFGIDLWEVAAKIGDMVKGLDDMIKKYDVVGGIVRFLVPFIVKLVNLIKEGVIWIKNWLEEMGVIENTSKGVIDTFRKLKESFKSFIDGIKETDNVPRYILEGLINGLKKGGSKVYDIVTNLAMKLYSAFTDFFQIHSPSKLMIAAAGFIIAGIAVGIKTYAPNAYSSMSNFGSGIFDVIKGWWNKILSFFKNVDAGGVFLGLISAGVFKSLVGLGNMLNAVSKPIKQLGDMMKSFKDVADSFAKSVKKVGSALNAELKADAFLKLAKAISILAASVAVLSFIPAGKLLSTVGALTALTIVIGGVMALIMKLNGGLIGGSKNSSVVKNITKYGTIVTALIGLAAVLLSLTVAVAVIAAVPNAKDAFFKLGIFIAGLLGVVAILTKFAQRKENMNTSGIEAVGKVIGKIALTIFSIAAAILVMSIIKEDRLKNAVKALRAILICIGVIVTVISSLNAYVSENAEKNMDGVISCLKAINKMILMLAISMKIISTVKEPWRAAGIILTVFGVMSVIIEAMALINEKFKIGGEVNAFANTIKQIATSFILIGVAFKIIGGMNTTYLWKAIAVFGAFSAAIIFLMAATNMIATNYASTSYNGDKQKLSNNFTDFGKMMIQIAGAFAILSVAIQIIARLNTKNIWKAMGVFGAFGLLVSGLMAATKLLKDSQKQTTTKNNKSTTKEIVSNISEFGKMILMVSAAMSVMSLAIAGLSFIDTKSLWKATAVIAVLTLLISGLMVATKLTTNSDPTTLKSLSALFAMITVMFISLLGGVISLSLIKTDKLWEAVVVVAIIGAIISGIMAATKLMTNNITGVGTLGLIVALIGIIMNFTILIADNLNGNNSSNVEKALVMTVSIMGSVMLLMLTMSAVAVILSKIKVPEGNDLKNLKTLLLYVGGLMIVAVGIVVGLSKLTSYFNVDNKTLLSMIGCVAALLVAMGVMAEDISEIKINKSFEKKQKSLTKFIWTIAGIIASMAILVAGLGVISTLGVNNKTLLTMIGSVVILLYGITKMSKTLVGLKIPRNIKKTTKFLWGMTAITAVCSIIIGLMASVVKASPSKILASSLAIVALLNGLTLCSKSLMNIEKTTVPKAGLKTMGIMALIVVTIIGVITLINKFVGEIPLSIELAASMSLLLISLAGASLILSKCEKTEHSAYGSVAIMGLVISGIMAVVALINKHIGEIKISIGSASSICILLIGLTVACLIAQAINPIPALWGAIGIGVFLVVLTGVMTIMGAIARIPGIIGLIDTFGDLMEHLGAAIGKAVAGFVDGASSTMPLFGTRLSQFANNSKPFFDMVASLPNDFEGKMISLAGGLAVIAKASLIDQISTFVDTLSKAITGDDGMNPLKRFGVHLTEFGEGLNDFFEKSEFLNDSSSRTKVKTLTEIVDSVAGLAASVDNVTIFDKLFGTDKPLTNLGDDLVGLMSRIQEFITFDAIDYSNPHDFFDEDTMADFEYRFGLVERIIEAGKKVSDFSGIGDASENGSGFHKLNSILQAWNEGNLAQTIKTFGDKFFEVYADSNFVDYVSTIEKVFDDIGSLTKLMGGNESYNFNLDSALFQDPEMFKYAISNIDQLMTSFIDPEFADKVNKVASNHDNISKVADSLGAMSTIMSSVVLAMNGIQEVSGSFDEMNEGTTDAVGKSYASTADAMQYFYDIERFIDVASTLSDKFEGIDSTKFQQNVDDLNAFINAVSSITAITLAHGENDISSVSTLIGSISKDGLNSFTNAFTDPYLLENTRKSVQYWFDQVGGYWIGEIEYKKMMNEMETIWTSMMNSLTTDEHKLELYSKIGELINEIKKALEEQDDEKRNAFWRIGEYIIEGIIEGINDNLKRLEEAGELIGKTVKEACEKVLDIESPSKVFKQIGVYVDEGFVNGVNENLPGIKQSGYDMGNAIDTSLRDYLGIHSPSWLMNIIGKYTSQGLIDGVESLMPYVSNAGLDLGNNLLDGLDMSGISDIGSTMNDALSGIGLSTSDLGLDSVDLSGLKNIKDNLFSSVSEFNLLDMISSGNTDSLDNLFSNLDFEGVLNNAIGEINVDSIFENLSDKFMNANGLSFDEDSLNTSITNDLNNMMSSIQTDLDSEEYTITPVLDLADVKHETEEINSLLSARKALEVNTNIEGKSNSSGSSGANYVYEFTQNNYSPKALRNIDIYRATKSQFSQLKGSYQQ